MVAVFFFYGLAFFVLGVAVLIYPKKGSEFPLAKHLWLIAVFGLLHGTHEWIEMLALIQAPFRRLSDIVHPVMLPFSFLFLVLFGSRLTAEMEKRYSFLKRLPAILLSAWLAAVAASGVDHIRADILARYLLGAPGIFLTSYVLFLQMREFGKLQLSVVVSNLRLAAAASFLYGIFAGLIVPRADFFPASFLNKEAFMETVGVPVQAFRALCAVAITFGIVRILGVFNWEVRETLRKSRDELEVRVEERTAELTLEVSERRKAEEEITSGKVFLQSILDGLAEPLMVVGTDYRVTLANRAAREFSGLKEPFYCHEAFHKKGVPCPLNDSDWLCSLDEVRKMGGPVTLVHRHYRGDGEPRYIEIFASPLREAGGGLTGVIESWRDITERKLMEQALIESEEKFSALFNQASDCILLLEPVPGGSPVIADINEAGCAMHGYAKEELIGKPIAFLDHPDSAKFIPDRARRIMAGESLQFETMHVRKDGSLFPLEASARLINIGGRSYMQAIDRDITERKKAEESIRLYSQAIEQTMDGVQIVDLTGRIVYSNRAVEHIYGFSPEEFQGRDVNEMNVDPDFANREILPAIQGAGKWSGELTVKHKDGRHFPVWLSASMVRNGRGEPIAMVGVVRDITERKRYEEKLKASVREKEVLLREIHHRVKNNMQVISSLLSLQSGYAGDDRLVGMLKESQDRIRSMLLVHERLYESKDLSNINFGDYIKKLATHLFHAYEVHAGRVALKVSGEDAALDVDAAIPCGLILNEMVTNSLKHAFPAGRKGNIVISFRRSPEGEYELLYSDDGVGIPPDVDIEKTGTLGLRLIGILVRQLGGRMELDSTGGTKFTIKFKERKIGKTEDTGR